jgi:hypothetical protein
MDIGVLHDVATILGRDTQTFIRMDRAPVGLCDIVSPDEIANRERCDEL